MIHCFLLVLVHLDFISWLIANKPRVVNIKSQELTGSSFIGQFLWPILHHQHVMGPRGKIKGKFISVADSTWWRAYWRLKSLLIFPRGLEKLKQRETVGHVCSSDCNVVLFVINNDGRVKISNTNELSRSDMWFKGHAAAISCQRMPGYANVLCLWLPRIMTLR